MQVAHIRPVRDGDAALVAMLTSQLGYPSTAEEIERRLAHLRGRPEDEVLVAVDDRDEVIGWIHVARIASIEASDTAIIGGLVVADGHRSSGIGAQLVAAAERWAREHGASTMTVRSRSTREGAHRFYERIGYVEIKRSHVFSRSLV